MIQKKMYLTPFRLSALVPCFWGRHTGSFTRQWRRHRLQLSPQIFCRRQAMSEHLLLWSILRMRNMIQTDACPMKKFPPICLAQTILNFIPVRAWLVILTVLHTDHCIWPEMYFITQRKVRSHPTKNERWIRNAGAWGSFRFKWYDRLYRLWFWRRWLYRRSLPFCSKQRQCWFLVWLYGILVGFHPAGFRWRKIKEAVWSYRALMLPVIFQNTWSLTISPRMVIMTVCFLPADFVFITSMPPLQTTNTVPPIWLLITTVLSTIPPITAGGS